MLNSSLASQVVSPPPSFKGVPILKIKVVFLLPYSSSEGGSGRPLFANLIQPTE